MIQYLYKTALVEGLRIINMIYSEDINKICALCRKSKTVVGSTEHLECTEKNEFVPLDGTCGRFEYDIFKKPTRRRRRLSQKFSADDFKL